MIELITTFVEPLEREGLRYLVTGSVAAMAYGEPRLTNDIDLILEIRIADIPSLAHAFPDSDYYLPPAEVIQTEQIRPQRGHFNIFHLETMLKADVYLAGSDPLHRWAFRNRLRLEIESIQISFAPPEYVIIRKLEFFREGGSEKHLRDVASMLVESASQINSTFLDGEVSARGLTAGWQKARDIAASDL